MFFDPSQEEIVDISYEPIPKDVYRVGVIDCDVRDTQARDGRLVAVVYQVLDGHYKDRRLFHNFNIENKSEKAQKIGRGQLKQFLEAIGQTKPLANENALYKAVENKTCYVDVGIETGKDGKERNRIWKFMFQKGSESKKAPAPTKLAKAAADDDPGF
jgi:hypothetical protein